MNIKCLIGLHEWQVREYDFQEWCQQCTRCRKQRRTHDWNGCKCAKCGCTRNEGHIWDGCKCAKCGTTRNEEHTWNGCKCAKCGATRNEEHIWNGCKCAKCGTTRNEEHDWSANCERCARCSACRTNSHKWDGHNTCVICERLDERVDPIQQALCEVYYQREKKGLERAAAVLQNAGEVDVVSILSTLPDHGGFASNYSPQLCSPGIEPVIREVAKAQKICGRTDAVAALVCFLVAKPNDCQNAAMVLGWIGNVRAIGPLTEYLSSAYRGEDEPGYGRVTSLGYFGAKGRVEAMSALVKIAGKEAAPAIVGALEHPSPQVRRAAADALRKLAYGHVWRGCRCLIYGTTRNEEHRWNGCECSVCGAIRDQHSFSGCTCRGCGEVRDCEHVVTQCRCKICEKTVHTWAFQGMPAGVGLKPDAKRAFRCSTCGKYEEALSYDASKILVIESAHGNTDEVRDLLGASVDPDAQNTFDVCLGLNKRIGTNDYVSNSGTALFYAVSYGHPDIARLLLENGAKPDLCAVGTSSTPLYVAVKQRRAAMVRLLLKHGANANQHNYNWPKKLIECAESDQIRKLLDCGSAAVRGDAG
jgi:hypothetical protein